MGFFRVSLTLRQAQGALDGLRGRSTSSGDPSTGSGDARLRRKSKIMMFFNTLDQKILTINLSGHIFIALLSSSP